MREGMSPRISQQHNRFGYHRSSFWRSVTRSACRRDALVSVAQHLLLSCWSVYDAVAVVFKPVYAVNESSSPVVFSFCRS